MGIEKETYKMTHRPRHANPIIKYDGEDRKELYTNIISMDYTDFAEGNSDEISISISDQKTNFLNGFFPETGKNLDVYIDYYHWFKPETKETYHCGDFTIDDITVKAGPRELIMKGVSQPANSEFKDTLRTKTWKESTLRTIAAEYMQTYNMTGTLYFHGEDPFIKEVNQEEESDLSFLSKICEKYGFCLKIYKLALVIFKKVYMRKGLRLKLIKGIQSGNQDGRGIGLFPEPIQELKFPTRILTNLKEEKREKSHYLIWKFLWEQKEGFYTLTKLLRQRRRQLKLQRPE